MKGLLGAIRKVAGSSYPIIVNEYFKDSKQSEEKYARPNKKISVFWVAGLKILGRVGTPTFFIIFIPGFFMHFERRFAANSMTKTRTNTNNEKDPQKKHRDTHKSSNAGVELSIPGGTVSGSIILSLSDKTISGLTLAQNLL